jgi:hypothetical protein
MSYSKGRITAPVSVHDVQVALGVGSGDVGTLCTHQNINVWARYRPIPCSDAANNKPQCITPAQRMSERYGILPPIDMFTADDISAFERYANSISEKGLYYIETRHWGDSHFKRLTDFSKDIYAGQATGKGYDHNARPDDVTVTINSGQSYEVGTHHLAPLVPVGQRILSIPSGSTNARFMFPVDHTWMDAYYQYVYGTRTGVSVEQNEEWLSPIDFMGTSTYSISYASVIRRILIFRWADSQDRIEGDQYFNPKDARWRFFNYATDRIQSSSSVWNNTERPFSSYPQAWLDLTDSETATNTYYTDATMPSHRMKLLTGRCLFIDCWKQSNSSVNVFPIIGYAYEVTIDRTGASVDIDISGVLTFERVDAYYNDSISIIGYISYEYITHVGETDEVMDVIYDNYSTLTITVGDQTINVRNSNYEQAVSHSGGMAMFEITIPQSMSTFPSNATMQGTRNGAALNPKVIPVEIAG